MSSNKSEKKVTANTLDLEVKDAQFIFETVWNSLRNEYGQNNLQFPKEIFWLNGAPGAGKGTQTSFIMRFRDLTAPPILVSELLDSPEANRLKDAGMMAGDREVIELVISKLLDPVYQSGAIVDGFPRTQVQVECLKLLYIKLMELRNSYINAKVEQYYNKPIFHIIVLFVDEAESVRRQLYRGKLTYEFNQQVKETGVGEEVNIRKTDLDEITARNRYRTFKEITYQSLKSLRVLFHYHFVNAHGSEEAVQERIVEELKYQSSLELDQSTYDRLSPIPIASQIVRHARQELIDRLDFYEKNHSGLFKNVVDLVKGKFLPIILRHSISGFAVINSEEEVFNDDLALAMFIDIFSERGYRATVDLRKVEVPDRIDPETYTIINRVKVVYRFRITFPGCEIRRG